MTKIQLEIDDTDLYNALRGIIKHANADEIAKVLAYCIGYSDTASSIFFKTYLGDVAPTPLPEGTMVKVSAHALTYKVRTDKLKEAGLLDEDDNATAVVKEFRGFHDRTTYYLKFTNIDENGQKYEESGFVNYKEILQVIDEF
jgi:hypothetical protein